ncbi:MAG: hypothetical protein ACXVXR_18070 [Blastococcus sp.]
MWTGISGLRNDIQAYLDWPHKYPGQPIPDLYRTGALHYSAASSATRQVPGEAPRTTKTVPTDSYDSRGPGPGTDRKIYDEVDTGVIDQLAHAAADVAEGRLLLAFGGLWRGPARMGGGSAAPSPALIAHRQAGVQGAGQGDEGE